MANVKEQEEKSRQTETMNLDKVHVFHRALYLRCAKDRDQPLSNNIFSTQLAFFLSIRAYQRIGTHIILMYTSYHIKGTH